jgi:hypothetical protein
MRDRRFAARITRVQSRISRGVLIARDEVKFVTSPAAMVEMRRQHLHLNRALIAGIHLPVDMERIRTTTWSSTGS